jgi:UDP-N-acetylmuramyl pentapeptide synthase
LQKLLENASQEFYEGDLVLLKASNAMKLGKLTE